MNRPRAILADDHAIVIEGLRRVLEPALEIVGTVGDGVALVAAAEALKPDVVIVDVSMPLLNGIEAARQIRKVARNVKIVFLSMHDDVIYAAEALRAGGSAYLVKSSAAKEVLTAIHSALQGVTFVTASIDGALLNEQFARAGPQEGGPKLTNRQREVLQLLAEGRSTKEIAEGLHVSPRTVEFHRYRIMDALGLRHAAQLVPYAIKHRLVTI
jgi:DNA-binding NarL/FixJ family response regulator